MITHPINDSCNYLISFQEAMIGWVCCLLFMTWLAAGSVIYGVRYPTLPTRHDGCVNKYNLTIYNGIGSSQYNSTIYNDIGGPSSDLMSMTHDLDTVSASSDVTDVFPIYQNGSIIGASHQINRYITHKAQYTQRRQMSGIFQNGFDRS